MPSDSVSGKTSSDIENVDWSVGTGHIPAVVRFGSSSSQTSQSSGDICRICHCEADPQNPLLTPCYCSGSLKYVHQACLQQWLTASETNSCELCKFPFIMHTKIKPFNEWRSLDMSGVERRRLFCAVLFHCAAALCVIWSLCVLIERAADEVKQEKIGWPFWTKLVVVTVGLTGGVVFMYIQCRQYLHLCNRWRARNRILLIQNAPEKFHPPSSPVLHIRNVPRSSGGSTSTTGGMMQNINLNNTTSNINNLNNMGGNQCSSSYSGRPQSHGQIIANIENNPHYERDWTLDDVSQVSFKPCPQGSGSLTPFHDSVHNMYEQQIRLNSGSDNSNCSRPDSIGDSNLFNHINSNQVPTNEQQQNSSNNVKNSTNDLNLFKVGKEQLKYPPASAIFLENRDILNDHNGVQPATTYSKLYHRHSAIIMPSDVIDNLDKLLLKDNTRRYSDTKLLQQQNSIDNKFVSKSSNQIFNLTNILGPTIHQPNVSHSVDTNLLALQQPQITDIIFERSGDSNFEPLDLNIQEMLESDIRRHSSNRSSQLSLNNQQIIGPGSAGIATSYSSNYLNNGMLPVSGASSSASASASSSTSSSNAKRGSNISQAGVTAGPKNIFKSLPNLNASRENLLQ